MKTNIEWNTAFHAVVHLKNLRRIYTERCAELKALDLPTIFWETEIKNIDETLKGFEE